MTPNEINQLADAVAVKVAERLAYNRPKMLSRTEMANALNISVQSLDRHTKAGLVPSTKLANGGRVLFDPQLVMEALNGKPKAD